MPELPEVETIVRALRPTLVGRRLAGLDAPAPRQVLPSPAAVRRAIAGRRVRALGRRGKWIVIALAGGGALLVHLRMSGRLTFSPEGERPEHLRARLRLTAGPSLLFFDARRFGRLRFVADPAAALAGLGPEPLARGLTAGRFLAMLRARRRLLKPLLLDQGFLAGLGNIYSDEALFRARLHPLERSDRLDARRAAMLLAAIRAVLREAIARSGTSLDWIYPGGRMQDALRVYGRGGEPCPRCGRTIRRIVLAQRAACFCPACQPAPRSRAP